MIWLNYQCKDLSDFISSVLIFLVKMTERPTFKSIFATERQMLYYTGVYTKQNESMSPLRILMRVLTLSFSTSMCVFMAMQMYKDMHEPQKVFDTLYFFLTQAGYVLKLWSFIYHKSELHKLEDRLEEEIFKSHKESQDKFIYDVRRHHAMLARTIQGIALSTATFYGIFPFIDNKLLAVPASFGIDPYKYRIWLNLYELACFYMNAYNNLTLDCIAVGLVNVASAQFEILKDHLEYHVAHEDDKVVEDNLKKCVIYHNAILDFVQRVEQIFTYGIFFQMVSGVLILCMTGIQFIIVPAKSLTFVSICFYFCTMICQVGIYEWFGQDILTNSSGIVQSCYMSNWPTYSTSNKKILFIIMERAKRPVILTAGYFVTLSLATYMAILRSAYSYFAVLRKMYQKQDNAN